MSRLRSYVAGAGLGPFMIRAAMGSSAIQAAGMLLTFLVGIQLARGLGASGYGHYGIAMAVIAIASIPGEFGLPKLVTREVASASASGDQSRLAGVIRWADRMSLLIALPLAAIIGLGSFLMLRYISAPVGTAIALGAPIIPLIALTRIRGGALQGLHFLVLGQIPVDLLRPLLLALLLLALFTLDPGAEAPQAIALNALTAATALVVAHHWLHARLPRPRPARTAQPGRRWLASTIPMAMTDGMRMLQPQVGVLLLGIWAAATQVGLFRVALSTMAMIAVPISLANSIAAPVLAKLHAEGDMRRLQQLSRRSAQAMVVGVLALSLPFLLIGDRLLEIVFGAEFGGAWPSLLVLCLGQLVSAGFGPNATLLNMTGHERRVTRAMALAVASNLSALLLLVPSLGPLGAAWASMVGLSIWNYLLWQDARRLLAVNTSFLPIRPGRIEGSA
jgi:O-antigen/teichoic acid export membrane protein